MVAGLRGAVALVATLALVASPRAARADVPPWLPLPQPAAPWDALELPDAPAPPSLPDLTHRAIDVQLEVTVGSVSATSTSEDGAATRRAASIERLAGEWAVIPRRFYVGAAEELAIGATPDSATPAFLASSPELWARGVWASKAGLSFGGGLGLVPPLVGREASSRATEVERQVRVIRPWDWSYFASSTFTARPFVDVRAIDGRILLQVREGLDVSVPLAGGTRAITSCTSVYAGYRVIDALGVGIEVTEVYALSSDELRDEQRGFYAVSPSVRLMTRRYQPALSVIAPVDRPLFGAADSFWAVRLDLSGIVDPSAP